MTTDPLPTDLHEIGLADLSVYLSSPSSSSALAECKKVADSFIHTGAVLIRDPRATSLLNTRFLDLLEAYFAQDLEQLREDERPEMSYQVGVTLENTEKPVCLRKQSCGEVIQGLREEERPVDLEGHETDPKMRFFWKMVNEARSGLEATTTLDAVAQAASAEKMMGESELTSSELGNTSEPNTNTSKPASFENANNVIPSAFADSWASIMNDWGQKMVQAVSGVSEMLAIGLGLLPNTYTSASLYGHHLLAPTATDLLRYGQKVNTIFAGFHQDLNFLSCHGKSRYPGLHIWARNSGKKIQVKVSDGCLLLQAGMQLEWATGGLIKAGYHEVVCSKETLKVSYKLFCYRTVRAVPSLINRAPCGLKTNYPPRPPPPSASSWHITQAIDHMRSTDPSRPLIRISSTLFYHLSPDHILESEPSLKKEAEKRFGHQEDYGRLSVADQVRRWVHINSSPRYGSSGWAGEMRQFPG